MRALMFVTLILSVNSVTATAQAANTTSPPSAQIRDVTACLQLMEAPVRLACFDRSAATLKAATEDHDMVVIDRAKIRSLQRTRPSSPEKDGSTAGPRKFSEAKGQITSARSRGDGQWSFSLNDGSSWVTIEAPASPPRGGDDVHVRRAALGSFFANINGQRAVRVHPTD